PESYRLTESPRVYAACSSYPGGQRVGTLARYCVRRHEPPKLRRIVALDYELECVNLTTHPRATVHEPLEMNHATHNPCEVCWPERRFYAVLLLFHVMDTSV